MSDEIELPEEWKEQGWTEETAAAEDEDEDSEWGTDAEVAAADPSEVEGEETEIG